MLWCFDKNKRVSSLIWQFFFFFLLFFLKRAAALAVEFVIALRVLFSRGSRSAWGYFIPLLLDLTTFLSLWSKSDNSTHFSSSPACSISWSTQKNHSPVVQIRFSASAMAHHYVTFLTSYHKSLPYRSLSSPDIIPVHKHFLFVLYRCIHTLLRAECGRMSCS